jgi:peptide alpha-N-acetyltransferase
MTDAPQKQRFGPKDEALYRSLHAHLDNREYAKGLEMCETLLKRHPNHVDTIAIKALFLAYTEKNSEALELAKYAIKIEIKNESAWHYLGIIHRLGKRYEEALKCVRMAVRLEPENQHAQRDLCLLQLQTRNFASLIDSRFTLVILRPTLRLHWINLAVAYHLAGFPGKAARTLEILLAVFPPPPSKLPQSVCIEEGQLRLYRAAQSSC